MSDSSTTAMSRTLRRIAETIDWPQPSGERLAVGDRVRDRNRPSQTGTVVAVSETPAQEFYIEALDTTVAEDNPGYVGCEPVVMVVWTRLRRPWP